MNQRTPEFTYVVSADGGVLELLRKDMTMVRLSKTKTAPDGESVEDALDAEFYIVGEYDAVADSLASGKSVDAGLQTFVSVVDQ